MPISRFDLYRVFMNSNQSETAIGLRIRGRSNMLITTIRDVGGRRDEETKITVHNPSIYGEPIDRTTFCLDEIENIVNLRISYDDPFYVQLRKLRNNIRKIREEVGLKRRR
jgi:hypothetical protein